MSINVNITSSIKKNLLQQNKDLFYSSLNLIYCWLYNKRNIWYIKFNFYDY